MCLLKSNVLATKPVYNGEVNGIDNCSSLEMEDCNETNGMIDNDISTASEQDCSVIVVDD